MEVLGAVASSIAIVQALAAGKHVISIVREIPDIQDDFNYLMKELSLIKSMAKAISRMPPSAYEQDLIDAAAEDLGQVTKELESLLRGCAHEVDTKATKVFKTRKRKWFLERGTITKLQKRMSNAKTTLHFAVTSSHATNDAQFQAYIQHMFMNLCDIRAVQNDTSGALSHEEPKIDRHTNSSESSALEAMTTNSQKDKEPVAELVSVQSLTHIRGTSSSIPCQCSCHFAKKTQYKNSGWVESLFGSWLVRCEARPQGCSNPDCQCISSSVLKLKYQVPQWLFFQSLAIVASYSNIGGLRCSLRPFKLIELDSPLWRYQKGTSEEIRKSVIKYGVYPCDADICGVGLIENALFRQSYIAIEALLDAWWNVLPELELSSRVANRINEMISKRGLHNHELYLLQKLVRLTGEQSAETTKIHIAIRRREGLQAALQEQPWAINTIDYTGHCPLTLATDRNQIACMEMLISAGADVNQVTSYGKSALLFAVKRVAPDPESVRLLLNSRCRVDWTSTFGKTALHFASFFHCVESVSLLIAAGASATRPSTLGKTPLHSLAKRDGGNRDYTKRIVELLVLAGADLETEDIYGYTPAMISLKECNISVLGCLLDMGCSLSCSNSDNRNILHLAAYYASLEMLEYLGSLGLYDINPYQKESGGRTPRDSIIKAYDGSRVSTRAPSSAELCAFFNLCQGIKDRSLQHDINNIEQVVAGLQSRDAATARKHLGSLLAKEERWKRKGLACWYRAVDKRVQNLEWDLATEDLSEYLTELKEELGTPVYEVPPEYGCTFLDSQIWEITTWESEASESEVSELETSE